MSSRSGRCCGSDPVTGLGLDPVFWFRSCVLGDSGPFGAGLVFGSGPDSGCGPDSGSGSDLGISPGSLGLWSTSGPSFTLGSGLGLSGNGPDFDFGSSLAFMVSILFGPGSLALTTWL